MNNRMFAIQDIKAGAFHGPFCAATEATAVRLCQDMVRRADHPYGMHPEDYVLYEVGEFDDINGMLVQGVSRSVCNLSTLV